VGKVVNKMPEASISYWV